MKMAAELFAQLRAAIGDDMPANASERQRWDSLWRAVDAGRFNIKTPYSAGLDDSHIDTALRAIAAGR